MRKKRRIGDEGFLHIGRSRILDKERKKKASKSEMSQKVQTLPY